MKIFSKWYSEKKKEMKIYVWFIHKEFISKYK